MIPPFDRILAGTTAIKILKYVEEEVIPNGLLEDGYVKRIVREHIKLSEAQNE